MISITRAAARAVLNPLRATRNRMVRFLHPVFRKRVESRIRDLDRVRAVCFVCLGNICRSPYAAARFRERARAHELDGVSVDSAGFIGPGRESPVEAQEVAHTLGIDLSGHRSRILKPEEMSHCDLLVVMDAQQERRLRRECPETRGSIIVLPDLDPRGGDRVIPDPFDKPRSAFEACYTQIDRCIEELVAVLLDRSSGEAILSASTNPPEPA